MRTFRARYGLTQDEVAAAIGAADGSAVGAWERGLSIPDGVRRQNVIDLLRGRRWRELRAPLVEGGEMPGRWREAAQWYRRWSRECPPREKLGPLIELVLEELQGVDALFTLRRRYIEHDGDWATQRDDRSGSRIRFSHPAPTNRGCSLRAPVARDCTRDPVGSTALAGAPNPARHRLSDFQGVPRSGGADRLNGPTRLQETRGGSLRLHLSGSLTQVAQRQALVRCARRTRSSCPDASAPVVEGRRLDPLPVKERVGGWVTGCPCARLAASG